MRQVTNNCLLLKCDHCEFPSCGKGESKGKNRFIQTKSRPLKHGPGPELIEKLQGCMVRIIKYFLDLKGALESRLRNF